MKNLTTKQTERLEKKKKKMAALSEIIRLNDKDGRKKTSINSDTIGTSSSDENCAASLSTETAQAASENSNSSRKRKNTITTAEVHHDKKVAKETVPIPKQQQEDCLTPRPITNAEYTSMKVSLHERKRKTRHGPKLRMKMFGDSASLEVDADNRLPIFLTDIQHLIMATMLGRESPCRPFRWCHVERSNKVSHTVVLVLEGCSLSQFNQNEALFKESSKLFDNKLEVVMPCNSSNVVEEFVTVSLTENQSDELIAKYGSLEAAVDATQNQMLLVKSVFPMTKSCVNKETAGDTIKEMIPRTQLLLSAIQLVDEGYPIPLKGELANRYKNYVFTSDSYAEVTPISPLFGLDCEMCRTSAGINELTRISIINEQFESIYETLVRPNNKIVDYLTKYSGITGAMMLNVTKTLAEVQADVRKLLPPDAILVGQSLQSDLVAMQMMHPYVIDTSVIFNISGDRRIKSKLQTLSLQYLGEIIQDNPLGHDSIEDCTASLKLTKLKLLNGVDYGDEVLIGRKRAHTLKRDGTADGGGDFVVPVKAKRIKTTAIIVAAEANADYEQYIRSMDSLVPHYNRSIFCHTAESNKCAVQKTKELAIQHDLTIAHLKLQPERMREEKIKKTLSKVDRWIANCWASVAPNGLIVVILGGGMTGMETGDDEKNIDHSGVVFLDIKNNTSSCVTSK